MAFHANAQPRRLEEDAIEIRLRAERRLGEMMAEQPKAQGVRVTPSSEVSVLECSASKGS